ncbi:MAG TPA: P1 family peptidase, partial [Nitriliruptorales bacterium]
GSIIVVVATDAPLLPHQCRRLAQRAALGVGRLGGQGENSSGDLILAFATGNAGQLPIEDREAAVDEATAAISSTANAAMNPLFDGVIAATEEAALNAMLMAETVRDARGGTVHALDPDLLRAAWYAPR